MLQSGACVPAEYCVRVLSPALACVRTLSPSLSLSPSLRQGSDLPRTSLSSSVRTTFCTYISILFAASSAISFSFSFSSVDLPCFLSCLCNQSNHTACSSQSNHTACSWFRSEICSWKRAGPGAVAQHASKVRSWEGRLPLPRAAERVCVLERHKRQPAKQNRRKKIS